VDDPLYLPTLTEDPDELRPRLRLLLLFLSTRAPGCIELARRNRFTRAAVPDGDGDVDDAAAAAVGAAVGSRGGLAKKSAAKN
jgi:hypothetical protein